MIEPITLRVNNTPEIGTMCWISRSVFLFIYSKILCDVTTPSV